MSGNHAIENLVAEALQPLGEDPRLLAAVSGGADSVAMLRALHALGIKPLVVTCNFQLRGAEADEDCSFVADLAAKLGLECRTEVFEAAAFAEQEKISIEMACRKLRYDKFREILAKEHLDRIAVAHNLDDNIETLLLNLMRGAGIRGLRGMLPDNGSVVRPLLQVPRAMIEEYLHSLGQDWRTDATNLEDEYSRNFLRLKVLPLLEQRWPQYRSAIARTQRNLRSDEVILESVLRREEPHLITLQQMQDYGISAIHRFARDCGANSAQAAEMEALSAQYRKGGRWLTPRGVIYADTRGLRFVETETPGVETRYECQVIGMTPETFAEMRSNKRKDVIYLPEPAESYTWRKPAVGDRIKPLGMKGSRLVSDVLKESGLDYEQRRAARLLVSTEDDAIVWVEGVCRSRLHLIGHAATQFYRLSPVHAKQ